MPQRLTPIQALLGGLATGFGQSQSPLNQLYLQRRQQRQQQQELKARTDQKGLIEQNLKFAIDEFGPESLQASGYRRMIMEMNTGMPADFDPSPQAQLPPLPAHVGPRLRLGLSAPILETERLTLESQFLVDQAEERKAIVKQERAVELARLKAVQVQAAKPEKGPSAGKITRVLNRRDTLIEEINESTKKIARMRKDLKLAPGEEPAPKMRWFGGEKKEQPALKTWKKHHNDRGKAQADLDRLRRGAERLDIDFELTAPLITQFDAADPAGIFK